MTINDNLKRESENTQQVNESQANYEKAEMDLLRDGLKRSHQERFLFATMLYKEQQTLKKSKIINKADNLKK